LFYVVEYIHVDAKRRQLDGVMVSWPSFKCPCLVLPKTINLVFVDSSLSTIRSKSRHWLTRSRENDIYVN